MAKFGIVCGTLFISFLISCNTNKSIFSSIEISTSGCYGECPVLDAKIENDKIYYNLIEYNNSNQGSYVLELNTYEINKINSLYNGLILDSLKNEYSNGIADGQRVKIKFLNKNISKQVFYTNGSAPKNLEDLVDFVIYLKNNKNLSKSDSLFLISTRVGFENIIPSIPPNPNE